MNMGDRSTAEARHRSIGGAEIGRCPTRLHHDRFTAGMPVEDPVRERFARRGLEFEREVLEPLATMDETTDLRDVALVDRWAATEGAIAAGASLILGARIEGLDGDTVGMPDILIRDGSGYCPIDVKHHKVVGDSGPPGVVAEVPRLLDRSGPAVAVRGHRRGDLLQVAHYAMLLDERGWAARPLWVGVIGSDEPLGCVWVELTAGAPSVLEEHADRLAEARAVVLHGAERPDDPLVPAAHRSECRTCPWAGLCIPELRRMGDPTLLRGIRADDRGRLSDLGIRTIHDVAALDPETEIVTRETVFQARAMASERLLRLPDVDLALDAAPIEVDLDIETYGPYTYLAGLAVTESAGTVYEPHAAWTGGLEGERAVLIPLFERLGELARRGAVVYHWTDYEVRRLTAGAERYDLTMPDGTTVESWFEAHAVDLWRWSREHLASPNGHGLKTIAPLCGFEWRDDDPGGLQSELWFEAQLGGDRASRDRILRYNEDDVLAQLAVRTYVRSACRGPGAGSRIPSVADWPV